MPFLRRTAAFAGLIVSTLALAPAVGADEHTVAPGENLTGIAARYCTSVGDVVARNEVTEPNMIYAGTRLDVVNRCASPPSTGHHEIASHLHLVPVFRAAATEFDVPVDLLMALTFTESRWRNEQVSATGAIGIGQLLPATADWLRALMDEPDLDESDVNDNARMSARLLRFLLDRTDDEPRLALAAYFQGIGDVRRNGIDAGGRRYADVVLARRAWFAGL